MWPVDEIFQGQMSYMNSYHSQLKLKSLDTGMDLCPVASWYLLNPRVISALKRIVAGN